MKLMENTNTTDQQVQHRRQRNFLIIGIISLTVLLGGVIGVWFWLGASKQPDNVIKDALSIKNEADSQVKVTSQLGFAFSYDKTFVDAHAQVTTSAKDGIIEGEEYSGDDITVPRSYNIVNLTVKKEVEQDQSLSFVSEPRMGVLTSAREKYFEPRRIEYPGLSDTEITVKEFTPTTSQLVSREQEIINNITYEKLLYEFRSTSTGQPFSLQLQYVTVQHGRPHVINLYYYPATKEGDLAPLIQALESMTYTAPAGEAQYLTSVLPDKPIMATASVRLTADGEETVSTPRELAEGTDLSIVAKNQLAVVRVGTIYCYDMSLLGTNGSPVLDLTDVCGGGGGSGSIVRDDGMVCTNGHVVKAEPRSALGTKLQLYILDKNTAELKKLIDYFVSIGLIRQADSQKLINDLMAADKTALQTLSAVLEKLPHSRYKIKKEAGEYAIQLGNDPVRLTFSAEGLKFSYSDTVVQAKYIDSEVDLSATTLATATASDVALLDIIPERTFPVVTIGDINTIKKGDRLTVMGFPGFVDGGVTTKEKHTVPTATQGKVSELFIDAGANKLLSASTMIAQGNSGGPAFDEDGKQIGLATYAAQSADPENGKTKFSKGGIFRDVADFTQLAAKHNVTFTGKSSVSDLWHTGIDTFAAGDYTKAIASFKELDTKYGDHYLVASFIDASDDQLNGLLRRNLLIGAGTFLAILIILGIIRLIKMLRHHPGQLPPAPQANTPFIPTA